MDKLIQYIIVRGDLSRSLSWPLGAVIAQCLFSLYKKLYSINDLF